MGEKHQVGLLVLHGNRLELLAEAVFTWLAANPLGPLEQETILVQSNGMAEWFKMELAGAQGVCASTTVELPARFIWRAYRAVLGRGAVPGTAPLDKLPLTWRLMHLLPSLADQPGCAAFWRWMPTSASVSSWPSGWPTCSTSTRSIAATGSRTGVKAATSSARVVKAGR